MINERQISNIEFTGNEYCNNSLRERLINNGFIYIDDLNRIYSWQLLAIRGIWLGKARLIQDVMKEFKIEFKDKKWNNKKYQHKPKDPFLGE